MSDDTLDPNRPDDQFRLDVTAQLGGMKRDIYEEYAGGPGVAPRTLINERTAREALEKQQQPVGVVAGIIREGATQGRQLVTLPGTTFGKVLLLFVLVIVLAFVLMWDGKGINITIGGTTVQEQTVEEQDVGQMKVFRPDSAPAIPPPPPIPTDDDAP